ncbi:MAG: 50S ribosomal protein L21 [Saprospiraceae bacterium]
MIKLLFEEVHLIDNDGKVNLGKPTLKGGKVTASVLTQVKGDKVLVFKKKRRKGYKRKNGHRQSFTQIQIDGDHRIINSFNSFLI